MDTKLQNLIAGFAVGVLVALLIGNFFVNNRSYEMMRTVGMGRGVEESVEDRIRRNEGMASMMHQDEDLGMDGMVDRLKNLSGDEFDREFVRLMIDHHWGAIEMATLIPLNSQREELRVMGEKIIEVQSAEIKMMEDWLDEWSN